MIILSPVLLTPSGRPVLQPGEVERGLLDKVDLEFQPRGGLALQQAEAYKGGYAILTTHRVIWIDSTTTPAAGRSCGLPLCSIAACRKHVSFGLKPKTRLGLEVYTNAQQMPVAATDFHTNVDVVQLRCRGPSPDAFKQLLDEQLRQLQQQQASGAGGPPSRGVGPGGASAGSGARPADLPNMSPLRAGLEALAAAPAGAAGQSHGSGPGPASGAYVHGAPLPPPPPLPSAAKPAPQPAADPGQTPDPSMLQMMIDMGFPRNKSARALVLTHNKDVQQAIDYLLAFGDQPGMDAPLDAPSAAAAAGTGAPSAGYGRPAGPGPSYGSTAMAAAQGLYSSGGGGGGWGAPGPAAGPGHGYPPPPPQQQPQSLYPAIGPVGLPPPAAPGAYGGQPFALPPAYPLPPPQPGQAAAGLYPHAVSHHYGSAPQLAPGASEATTPPWASSSSLAPGQGEAGLPPPDRSAGGGAIGVAGIVRREQDKTTETGRTVEQAFQDLSALMASAATMVQLAEKFRGVMAEGAQGGGGEGGGGEDDLLLDRDTQLQLIALGISSPVTKETAGARYHLELSRQLADFLAEPLRRSAGILSMPDVYCLFNRARGTELVSPDDLLQAAKVFGQAGVSGLVLRTFPSGVMVIQGPQHSEERVLACIRELVAGSAPPPALGNAVTAGDVARALGGTSVAIATEHLTWAEARGVLCRDDGPEGLRFYRNFFRDPQTATAC